VAAPFLIGTSGGTTASSQVINVGTAVPGGDAVMVFMGASTVSSQTVTGVTDSKGNTYARVIAAAVTTGHFLDCWAAFGVTALTTSDTITITWSSALTGKTQAAIGISGVPSTSAAAVDQKTTASGASTTPTVTTGTLAQASEVAIGCINSTNVQTISFTALSSTTTTVDQTTGYTNTSSTAAVTMTGSASDSGWGAAVITLKLTATGPAAPAQIPPVPRRRPSRGFSAGQPGAGARVAVPAPVQLLTAPRRRPARAVIGFTPVAGTNAQPVAVPAPVQLLTAPRRRPARAVIGFTPVRGANAVPALGLPLRAPQLPRRRAPQRAVLPPLRISRVAPVIPPRPSAAGDTVHPWRKHPWPRTPIGIPVLDPGPAASTGTETRILPEDPAALAPGQSAGAVWSPAGPGLTERARTAAGEAIAAATGAAARNVPDSGALTDPGIADAVSYWQQHRTKKRGRH